MCTNSDPNNTPCSCRKKYALIALGLLALAAVAWWWWKKNRAAAA